MRPITRVVVSAVMLLCLLWVGSSVAASSLPLTQRVLKAGQFAGLKPSSPPTVIRNGAAFFQGDQALEARLRQLGFVAGVAEQLMTPGNPNRGGLSEVVQLSSAANAKSALKYYYTSNGPWTSSPSPESQARSASSSQVGGFGGATSALRADPTFT